MAEYTVLRTAKAYEIAADTMTLWDDELEALCCFRVKGGKAVYEHAAVIESRVSQSVRVSYLTSKYIPSLKREGVHVVTRYIDAETECEVLREHADLTDHSGDEHGPKAHYHVKPAFGGQPFPVFFFTGESLKEVPMADADPATK